MDIGHIANEIHKARVARAWSLEKLAGEAGVSRQTITNIERGQSKITMDVMARVAQALDLRVSALISLAEQSAIGEE